MRILVTLAAATLALGSHVTTAQTTSQATESNVQWLLGKCQESPAATFNQGFCLGYVASTLYVLTAIGADMFTKDEDPRFVEKMKSLGACGQITYGAAEQAFVNWARKHPEHWGDPARIGVETALIETWPCK